MNKKKVLTWVAVLVAEIALAQKSSNCSYVDSLWVELDDAILNGAVLPPNEGTYLWICTLNGYPIFTENQLFLIRDQILVWKDSINVYAQSEVQINCGPFGKGYICQWTYHLDARDYMLEFTGVATNNYTVTIYTKKRHRKKWKAKSYGLIKFLG